MITYSKTWLSFVIFIFSATVLLAQRKQDINSYTFNNNENKGLTSSPCEHFDSLAIGGYVAGQLGGLWTTWSGSPGGPEDAIVSDSLSYSPDKSFVVNSTTTDLLFLFDPAPITTGAWSYSHNMYIPSGFSGYFNVQSDPTPGINWVIELFFDDGEAGHFTVDGTNTDFTYPQDTWFNVKINFDLDSNTGIVMFNNELVFSFITTYSIGGIDYFGSDSGGPPYAFYDDVCFLAEGPCFDPPSNLIITVNNNIVSLTFDPPQCPNIQGYNIYINDIFIGSTSSTSYQTELESGTYNICVSAVYVEGESIPVCDSVTILPAPPKSFSILDTWFQVGDPIPMNWHPPSYNAPVNEWIQWDDGVNGDNGIGITAGGTFNCASHWEPSDLNQYSGNYLTKISYYHYVNAETSTFVLKVWQGENANILLLSQAVTSSVPGEWNVITLDTPVQIDDSQEFWFGYEVTNSPGEMPAGVDEGPAIQYKGDMISFDASYWVSMSAEYGLDYNWNLAGYVSSSAGGKEIAKPMKKTLHNYKSGKIEMASGYSGDKIKFKPKDGKELSFYKVYRDGNLIGTTTDTVFTDYNYPGFSFYYIYYVTAIYDSVYESVPSNSDTAYFATGISEHPGKYLKIFPNPVSDVVTISSKALINRIKLFTSTGQLIIDTDVQDNNFRIEMSDFEKGIYLIKVETTNGVVVEQIIKN